VVWNSESAAKAFIASKGGGRRVQPVSVNEQAMEKMAKALGCPVEKTHAGALSILERYLDVVDQSGPPELSRREDNEVAIGG